MNNSFGFDADALDVLFKDPENVKWLVAFAIAYILVKHGGELLGLGQNLSVLVGMLMA